MSLRAGWLGSAWKGMTTPPRNNVPTLDVLRSLAILLVFSGHFTNEYGASAAVQHFPLVYFGWTGVDLFFVLSGLLIGTQLWKELKASGRIRIGTFLLRRGLRIWPLYFAFVLLIAAEAILFHRNSSGLWADACMVSNYFHHQIGGGWSLSTEEQFYLFLPVSLALLSRRLNLRQMVVLPVAGLGLLPLIRALTIAYSGLNLAAARDYMYSPIHTHSDGLAIGVLLAWVTLFRPEKLQSARQLAVNSVFMLTLAGILYFLNREVFKYSSLAMIFGAAVFLALGLRNTPAILRWRGFYVISRLSYGIYLNHFGLVPRITPPLMFLHRYGTPGYFVGYAMVFLACTAFAAGTFVLIEWPFLQMRENWLASRRPARMEQACVAT
jgi:peptidoglycan/LPS O-acetylase OafA/YrhL